METVCPPFYMCQGGVVALAVSTVRLPCLCSHKLFKRSSTCLGSWTFSIRRVEGEIMYMLLHSHLSLGKKCSVQYSMKDLGFSGAAKAVHKMNFYCQNGSYYLECFRLHLYKAARNCSLESYGKAL